MDIKRDARGVSSGGEICACKRIEGWRGRIWISAHKSYWNGLCSCRNYGAAPDWLLNKTERGCRRRRVRGRGQQWPLRYSVSSANETCAEVVGVAVGVVTIQAEQGVREPNKFEPR